MIVFRVVRGVFDHFMSRLPEWICTTIMMSYGLTLLAPPDTFDGPAYTVMRHYASENTWGMSLTALSSVRLVALIINGTFPAFAKWSVRFRALCASLGCFGWFCVALGLFLATPWAPGARTYTALLLTDVIVAIYLGGQAGKADRGIWNGRHG